jgi:unsaturated rhamnogalacturonyl hydrolase
MKRVTIIVSIISLYSVSGCQNRADASGTPATGSAKPALEKKPATAPESPPRTVAAALVSVENPLGEARKSETIVIPVSDIEKFWLEPSKTLVVDEAGKPVLSQLVDMDGDEAVDELVFQTDFAPNQKKTFTLRPGARPSPAPNEHRVYGRFVRERFDDFAWENDRIARRMYGPALETWVREPLTSSGIDAWVKRTPKLVINDWYMTGDYHKDRGEGADLYSVGKTRGCGGTGVWANGKLAVSKNFKSSRVFANGPIRLVFELEYAPWDASGTKVSETKRIVLDAGKSFERFESRLKAQGKNAPLEIGIGIAKHAGGTAEYDRDSGALVSWEPIKGNNGQFGCAIIVGSEKQPRQEQGDTDFLLVARADDENKLAYHGGFAWDRSGEVKDLPSFAKRVQQVARELRSPIRVSVAATADAVPWSARTCDTLMDRHPSVLTDEWDYDTGMELRGFEQVWLSTKKRKYFDYVKRTIDGIVEPSGVIKGYQLEKYNIDMINMGKVLFALRDDAKNERDKQRYEKALHLLRSQMKDQPRTKAGGFWHKKIYPHQMWLDGLYMAAPFLTKYALVFDEPALIDDVAHQITLIERLTRDAKTGLLYHGHDESKEQRWADPKTGRSPNFWGRAMGWYSMALVDVLELMPEQHPKRPAVLAVFRRLAAAVAAVQDPDKGVWWQILDAPKRDKNYLEASASSMFVYALAKGVNNGWLDEKYRTVATRGYDGILSQFVDIDEKGRLDLKNVCKVAGLGGKPYRDGSYAYYTSTEVVKNDPKGVGAFILASVERDKMDGR